RDLGDVADLARQVRRHEVDVVGEVFPRTRNAGHDGLATELAFRADLARHARDFRREAVQLVHHRVDGVLQLENLALDVDHDLAREVAVGDGGGDVGDVADLAREVEGHRVDVVGEVFPGSRDAGHLGLTTQLAFGADLARDAADFGREGVELVHHRVDGVLQLQNLAFDVHRDLAREVALGDGGRHVRDVADLAREVGGHRVHVVGEVFPRARDAGHRGLATELAFRADLARHAADFGGEGVQLVHHRVDGVLQFENFTLDVDRDLSGEVAARDGRGDVRDVADLAGEVRRHRIDRVGQVLPRARDAGDGRLSTELAFGADLARHARDFRREAVQLVHHRVDGVIELQNLTADVHGDLLGEVAV